MSSFYITTTLPYVNADPHIGFALEIIQADALVRFERMMGNNVFFNTGTDEHGLKIYRKAQEQGVDPQAYCDEYAAKFDNLKGALNLSYNNFIRTTDEHHIKAAQEMWKRCFDNGDIYKKNYQIKYCVGCELEKTDSELVDDRCPLHPKQEIEMISEENYFFRWSNYQEKLLELYEKNPEFVKPASKLEEIKNFVKNGLEDFSISRLKNKMPWGISVPGDEEHVMYVWFDALVNYIAAVGWPENDTEFNNWWPGTQVAGKDNLRQQSAMWQAMLMSAAVPTSKQIFIHGFITSGGQKMSKSTSNVVSPYDLVKTYGTDVVRYYLLKEIPSLDDGDFSDRRMKEVYSSDLANELGNLVSRITTIAQKDELIVPAEEISFSSETQELFHSFQFNAVLTAIWEDVKILNKQISDFEPWSKTADDRKEFLTKTIQQIRRLAYHLSPFMPVTAEKIMTATVDKITKVPPLFPRLT